MLYSILTCSEAYIGVVIKICYISNKYLVEGLFHKVDEIVVKTR